MLRKLLDKSFKEKKLISVTTPFIEWEESIIGYIVNIDDYYITLNELDEYGMFIGRTTITIEDICHISPENWYIRNLSSIHTQLSTFDNNAKVVIHKKGEEVIPHLNYLKENKKITCFYFEDDYFAIGIILDFDTECFLIESIGQDGSKDGICCYRINDIIDLRYDSLEEQRISLLFGHSNETRK